jgi:hypothetical protein
VPGSSGSGDAATRWWVKRSTAIGHLVEMAQVASQRLTLRDTDIGWPLEELWVTGDLLGLADSMEAGSVVLVLDLPAGELVWLALHPVAEWVGEQLRVGKRPMQWSYRPVTWGCVPPSGGLRDDPRCQSPGVISATG